MTDGDHMSNRTDWENVAADLVEVAQDEPTALRERIAVELHNAYVAGQEGSLEVGDDDKTGLVGSLEYKPFKIYARGERRPFGLGGDGPVIFGCLRWVPINEDGTVTLSDEALRDLCHHVYRSGWRFGEMVSRDRATGEQPVNSFPKIP